MRTLLKETSDWLRVDSHGQPIGVDRKRAIVHGFVIAQEGPFKSEGRGEFDGESLRTIVKLTRSAPNGLKSRFTHPDLSSDGLGKFLGRVKNPRLDTIGVRESDGQLKVNRVEVVRGDLHIDATALKTPPEGGRPLGDYVMALAESDPDALSSSLVLQVDEAWRLDRHGHPQRDADGNELPPLWRPTRLHASDVVDTGDAVDGFLSVAGLPDAAVRRGAEILDRQFGNADAATIRARCNSYLDRYINRRFGSGDSEYDPARDAEKALMRRRLAEITADPLPQQYDPARGSMALFDETLTGWCVVWNKMGEGHVANQLFAPGAFDASLATGCNIIALVDHDWEQIIGSTYAGNLRVWPDHYGLAYRLTPRDNPAGRRAVAATQSGEFQGASAGYDVQYERKNAMWAGVYWDSIIRQADLYEISVLPIGAYPQATCTIARDELVGA